MRTLWLSLHVRVCHGQWQIGLNILNLTFQLLTYMKLCQKINSNMFSLYITIFLHAPSVSNIKLAPGNQNVTKIVIYNNFLITLCPIPYKAPCLIRERLLNIQKVWGTVKCHRPHVVMISITLTWSLHAWDVTLLEKCWTKLKILMTLYPSFFLNQTV